MADWNSVVDTGQGPSASVPQALSWNDVVGTPAPVAPASAPPAPSAKPDFLQNSELYGAGPRMLGMNPDNQYTQAAMGAVRGVDKVLGGDFFNAGLDAVKDRIVGMINGSTTMGFAQHLAREQARSNQIQENAPASFLGGEIGGAVLPAGRAVRGAEIAAKALPSSVPAWASTIAKNTLAGGAAGTFEGAATGPVDPSQPVLGQVGDNAVQGAERGGIVAGGMGAAGAALNAIPQKGLGLITGLAGAHTVLNPSALSVEGFLASLGLHGAKYAATKYPGAAPYIAAPVATLHGDKESDYLNRLK